MARRGDGNQWRFPLDPRHSLVDGACLVLCLVRAERGPRVTCSVECVPRGKGAGRETRAERGRGKATGQEETVAEEERNRVQGLSC